jgi:hypothetical protein
VPLVDELTLAFPEQPGSDKHARGPIVSESVTVRVTYAYQCQVPLAAALLCKDRPDLHVRTLEAEATLPLQRMRSTP